MIVGETKQSLLSPKPANTKSFGTEHFVELIVGERRAQFGHQFLDTGFVADAEILERLLHLGG